MDKILFVANQYYPNVVGGAEVTVQILAEQLARRGHSVVVVSLSPTDADTFDTINGVSVYRVAVRNLYYPFGGERGALQRMLWHLVDVYNPMMGAKLAGILDQERPQVVCTHNLSGFSVSAWHAAKRRELTLVHTLHDYYLICPRTTLHSKQVNCSTPCVTCKLYSAPKRFASTQPDLVIGVSRFVLEKHLAAGYFSGAQTGVVYNGRALPASHSPRERAPNQPLRIGFIGRLHPIKGIETLLQAVSKLPPDGWTLRVAGRAYPASYADELKQRYPLPQVDYVGYVDADEFYPTVDVVVVPSEWQEPLGCVVYEPLGFGIPVIAARVGGIPEILEDAGCGWLFEPGDADALAARLATLLGPWPDAERIKARALERRKAFLPERQAEEFGALLRATRDKRTAERPRAPAPARGS